MADAEFTMVFKIREDGSLVLAEKNIAKAGKAVKDLGAAHSAAGKQADDHYSKQNKGVIGTANSTKSFSKLTQTIGDGSNGLVGAYAGLAANAFAVSAAFITLSKAAQAQTLMQGLIEQGARAGKTLTILSGQLKELTNDSISSAEAMQATAQATASGISGADLKKLTVVANDAALALGRNVPDSLNRMVLAVTKMEPELVDELGLTTKITEASEKYARQLGISVTSMSQAQKQQALLNAWVEQGTLKYGGLADAVDPNPYNKLAATFDNLVKSGGNIANVLLNPLIKLLGASQAALFGFGLVFLGSIKGQILPGIQEASSKALKASKAAQEASIEALSGQVQLGSGRRKAINEFIAASKDGSASQLQFEKAIKESNDRISSAETRKKPLKPETLARIKTDEADRQAELNKIKVEGAKSTILQAQADGYAASEGTNLTNSYTKLKDTVKATGASYMASYSGSKTAETGLKGLANTAAATGKGIAAAGKVAAVGFLNFIPVIGQVIAILAILWELVGKNVWAKLTGRTEEVSKALDNFNETMDSTANKLKALQAIENSTASAADRAVAAVSNQAATIYELADSYDALVKAKLESEKTSKKEEEAATRQRSLYQEMAAARQSGNKELLAQLESEQKATITARRTGISATSMAAKAFSAQSSELWMNDEYVAAAQALEQLEKQLPEAAKGFYDLNGGVDEFNKLDPAVKVRLVNEQLQHTAALARTVENAFKGLDQSINSLNTGYVDFIKSITPTTQYDSIVTNLQNFSKSVNETKAAMLQMKASGGGDSLQLEERLAATVTGIEGPARNMFTGGTREILNYFDTIDRSIQTSRAGLEGLDSNSTEYKTKQEEINSLTLTRKQLLSDNIGTILKEVSAYETIVTNAQVEQIRREGTLALAQANLKVLQKQGQVTGEDVERQMRAENAIIELQAQQLETQIIILTQDLEREKSALRLIESNQKLLEVYQKQTAEARTQTIASRLLGIESELNAVRGKTDEASALKRAQLLSEQTSAKNAQTDIDSESLRLANDQVQLQNSIRVKQEGINSLLAQAQALRMGANTEAEILNARIKKQYENQKQANDIMASTEEVYKNISSMERDITNLLSKNTSELDNQLRNLEDQFAIKTEQFRREWDFREKILKADLQLAKTRGNTSQVAYYEELLRLEGARNVAQLAQADTELYRNRIQAVAIKNIEEEISLRKKSSELTQKIIEANNQSMQAEYDNASAIVSLERKRAGAADTEASRDIEAIRAAELAYELAAAEVTIKTALIQLEFQLLEAQRLQSIEDLRKRAGVLREEQTRLAGEEEARRTAAAGRATTADSTTAPTEADSILVQGRRPPIPASEQAAAQAKVLEDTATAMEAIGGTTLTKAGNDAIQALTLGLATLKTKFEESLIPGPRVKDGIASQFQATKDIIDRFVIRKAKATELNTNDNANDNIPDPSKVALATDLIKGYVDSVRKSFEELGPEGAVVLAVMDSAVNISNSFQDAFSTLASSSATAGEKVAAVAQAISSVLAGIQSITTAASNAKIAGIDKEISAEEKRDGKSAASVAKLEALEKKKDGIARKQFNLNKKLMMAQAVMSTAAGIAGALAAPFGLGIPLAILVGAMGAAQIALIAGTQFESSYSPKAVTMPTNLSIGKRSDTVDLAQGANANAGAEVSYLRGSQGTGTNASNYRTVGSAYGGELMRGYGNRGFVVGEKGPEVITPDTPISVTPANDVGQAQSINANFNIQALDSQGVQDILVGQKGNIIKMLRQAANASGKTFMEDVNVNVYTRPSVGKL